MNLQINKLTSLIEDLLDTTRMEGGKLKFNESIFSLDDLTQEVIEEVERTTQKHSIHLIGETSKKVFADKDRVGQVIINLLTNAIKYSPNSDKVIVKLSEDKGQVTIRVQDFGVGISKQDLKHVFDRFYRETGNKQETFPGLGLGLYISSEIISRHKGKIWVESEKGKGSTFCFSLPLYKSNS
jgi:signal transduction histidine kinase